MQAKDIFIEELPPTPNAPTWEKLGGYKVPPPKEKKAPAAPAAGEGPSDPSQN